MVSTREETLTVTFPNLNSTMGALLVGSFLATLLYGITSHQFFRYFRMYPRDEVSLKAMVGGLWFLDSVHLIFFMHTCYHYLVTHYLQPTTLEHDVVTGSSHYNSSNYSYNPLLLCSADISL